MTKIFKIVSSLKAATGFSYAAEGKDKHGRVKNRSVMVVVPGKKRPDEKTRPVTFITEAEYKALIKPGHAGKKSPFKILMESGESGGENGIIVKEISFDELPEEFQKKFDSKQFAKLKAAKKKLLQEEMDKDKKNKEGEENTEGEEGEEE